MRKLVRFAIAVTVVACASLTRQGESDEVVVRKLEETVAAATERNDANALDPFLSSDFTFVNPPGLLLSKEQ